MLGHLHAPMPNPRGSTFSAARGVVAWLRHEAIVSSSDPVASCHVLAVGQRLQSGVARVLSVICRHDDGGESERW